MNYKWYDTGIFYHIYPLGLTGAPERNEGGAVEHRIRDLWPWVDHLVSLGCNGLYIGPLFESGSHGYDTTDYKRLDRRLGDNQDLKEFVAYCHEKGVKVLFDGVFNHVGRDFFAFQDLKANREGSRYRDWFCNVNFWGNNEYNDGFSYGNWHGYNLLVKLNQRNGEVQSYIREVIHYWVKEFDVDGLRLDAADVLDFGFMNMLRRTADEVKPDFWLMGEVIHGEYTRWVNREHLHSLTNYHLHKALFSGHNDHNYFEIAHTVKRIHDMDRSRPEGLKLYNFVDNHDVERIASKLRNAAHFAPVHVLLYTLPGVPSLYYGSEFGIQGRKRHGSDAPLRPALKRSDYADALEHNPCTRLIARLGQVRARSAALSCGDYRQLLLATKQYAFSRTLGEETVLVLVNNDDAPYTARLSAHGDYVAALSGESLHAENGRLQVSVGPNSGEIYLPARQAPEGHWESVQFELKSTPEAVSAADAAPAVKMAAKVPVGKSYEQMSVEELQRVIYEKMAGNGPVTDQMRRSIEENTHHGSLVNWAKSFR